MLRRQVGLNEAPVPFALSQSIAVLPDAIWVLIGAAVVVGAIFGVAAYRDRLDAKARKEGTRPPSGNPVRDSRGAARRGDGRNAAPPSGNPVPAKAKTAAEVFKEAFPEIKVAPQPLPAVPFALRVTEVDTSSIRDGRSRPCLRVEVSGSVPLGVATDLALLLTVEDLTTKSVQHVFATVDSLQDDRTGLFVERARLGLIDPPGLRHAGWREIALIPTSFLQAPRSGRRRLRFSCLGVPARNAGVSVIDPLLRSEIHCTAVAEVEADLPAKGYLEEDHDREQAAGMILCVGWGFAHAMGVVEKKVAPVVTAWMTQASSLLGGATDQPSVSLQRVMDGADKLGRSGGVGFVPAWEMLARLHVPEAPLMAFDLCCRIAKAFGGPPEVAYALLRDGAIAMGVEPDEFARLMRTYLAGPAVTSDEELVGLDPSWDKERIHRFLREQFGKWNARSGGATDLAERRKIAIRLNAIAKLRQKYR
jgi:hypothetical protein